MAVAVTPIGGDSLSPAETVMFPIEMWFPLVLIIAFMVAAAVHSVVTARSEEELIVPEARGPDGKPLPLTRKKKKRPTKKPRGPAPDPFLVLSDDGRKEAKEEDEEEDRVDPFFSLAARRTFQTLTLLVLATFIAQSVLIAVHALVVKSASHGQRGWWCENERIVYIVGDAFVWLYFLITLFEWRDSPIIVHCISWAVAAVGELIILITTTARVLGPHHVVKNVRPLRTGLVSTADKWDITDVVIAAVRLTLVVALVALYLTIKISHALHNPPSKTDQQASSEAPNESTPLVSNGGINYQTNAGSDQQQDRPDALENTANGHTGPEEDEEEGKEPAAFYRPDKLPHKTWYEYLRGYTIFFPYLWPSRSWGLQGTILLCFILVIAQRVVNILVPIQTGLVVLRLTQVEDGQSKMPWKDVLLLMLYRFLQGQSGLLGSLRSILWIPVSQHTYRALTTSSFEHVHSLSLDFHLIKKTGEVLSALNKGASINEFLEQITFQVVPMLSDLGLAIIFFSLKFGSIYALLITIIVFYYLYLTIRMASTRSDQRRDMVNADREEEGIKSDSIISYETVKYFNAEAFEFKRYRAAIEKFQMYEAKVTWGIGYMNICQSFVFMVGIMVAMLLCAYQVTEGTRNIDDFIALITYLAQLQGPLNFFGTFYRTVQQSIISGERLLELFKYRPNVEDAPDAKPLVNCKGGIRWTGVTFSYDDSKPWRAGKPKRYALQDLSFDIPANSTIAFVGESGGGKSTIFRLLFRYYPILEGKIEIDGKDVSSLTIESIRRAIGVVPQDTILFNDTIMFNLRYANPNATDDEIHQACRIALIHERIMSFPDGYDTKVGERGLRLSGGEKQRVAIARVLLKNPKIVLLDEATSALDGDTEQKIQAKMLRGDFGRGRTLLIIAHRLSTITHADQIIVLHQGRCVERGTHDELVAMKGRYASMWIKHCRAEAAAEEARAATREAKNLLRQANIPAGDRDGRSDGYDSMSSSTIIHTGVSTPAVSHATGSGENGSAHGATSREASPFREPEPNSTVQRASSEPR